MVDSDDWLDTDSLQKLLTRLRTLIQQDLAPDMLICNYVYEHVEDAPPTLCAIPTCSPPSVCSTGSTWGISARTSIC